MKRFSGRAAVAALALALATAPAMAGGGYGGGYHHHHHGGGGSSSGWWIGGAFALAAVGLMLAADSGPSYAQAGVYAPGVGYTSPPVYGAPVYAAPVYDAPLYDPPPAYAPAQPQYTPAQYEPAQRVDTPQAHATADCRRWAMNQSGYDPATISQWTTQVMVDTYNRMLDSCMANRH
ncbi:hypothetical protein ACXIUT_06465 [Achromobacter denitrificans]